MGTVVLDSCVLLGVLHADDNLHDASSSALTMHHDAGDRFVLSAIVLAEALVRTARVEPAHVATVKSLLGSMLGPVRAVDGEVAAEAARLLAKHKSLRLPDALIIATGIVDEADTILTADKRWARIDKRVTVL